MRSKICRVESPDELAVKRWLSLEQKKSPQSKLESLRASFEHSHFHGRSFIPHVWILIEILVVREQYQTRVTPPTLFKMSYSL